MQEAVERSCGGGEVAKKLRNDSGMVAILYSRWSLPDAPIDYP